MWINDIFWYGWLGFSALVAIAGFLKAFWYWVDDNKMPVHNPLLLAISVAIFNFENRNRQIAYKYDNFSWADSFCGISFAWLLLYVIVWAFTLFPITIVSIVSCFFGSFALRWVIRLNKKVEQLRL